MTDKVQFTTERGADVTVTADAGTLFVSVDSGAVQIDETSGRLDQHKGREVLSLGKHTINGNTQVLDIPINGHKADLETLREESKDDTPLTYTVEEYTKTIRAGGWGEREIEKERLVPSKQFGEMSEREQELSLKVDTDYVPEDAEPGDVLTLEDLVDDPRTADERDQDALDEAAETGEEVTITTTTEPCNDPSKECDLDHVTRVATPEGEIETRRIHTY